MDLNVQAQARVYDTRGSFTGPQHSSEPGHPIGGSDSAAVLASTGSLGRQRLDPQRCALDDGPAVVVASCARGLRSSSKGDADSSAKS
jgi:hypothetical protein